jgi:hypothetical protein
MSLTYGFEVKSHEDPFLAAAERGLILSERVTVPGAFLVDTFPICTHQRENALRMLSVIYSEIRPIVVPWSGVQALRTGRAKGP